jgi:outer membrane receptor protein involved in Fe transport
MFAAKRLLASALTLVLALGSIALAQSSKGIVVGILTDPQNARVAGADVKITNTETNVTRETTSTGEGTFRFDAVDPGTYTVTVNAVGFRGTTATDVKVLAAQTADLSFSLNVGVEENVVNVTAGDDVALQTQDGSRSNTLNRTQITELPIANLNPTALVFTLPGVADPGPLSGGFVQGTEFSVNGLRPRSNNQLLDGTDNNDPTITGQTYQPVLRDGFQEVAVLVGNNAAEYGRSGGAVTNVTTRSGTNQFHGSVYDVIEPSKLAALTSEQKVEQLLTEVPVTVSNSYGFSLGGPIKKDKLFFFGTFQASPFRSTVNASGGVPTEAGVQTLRALFPAGTSPNVDRYLALLGDARGQTSFFLAPLGDGRPDVEFGTATVSSSQSVNDYQYLGRVDWAASDRDALAFRYLAQKQDFLNQFPSIIPGFEIDVISLTQNFLGTYTRTINDHVTNEFRFSWQRARVPFGPRNADLANSGPQLTFASGNIAPVGLPAGFPQGRTFNNFQFQDTVTWIKGAHTIRAGADIVHSSADEIVPNDLRGTLAFSAGGGFGEFANFVDSFSGTNGQVANRIFGPGEVSPTRVNQGYFVSDAWRVRENLTLNLGLRYDYYGTPFNAAPFPAFPGFDAPFDAVVLQKADKNNFGPRFSFAYTPHWGERFFGEDKTVFRGGYALTYDVFFDNILQNIAATSPSSAGFQLFGFQAPAGSRGFGNFTSDVLPSSAAPSAFASNNQIAPNLLAPAIHTWNFGVQRELPAKMVLDVAYVGTRGTHLLLNNNINPLRNGQRIHPNRGDVLIRDNSGDSIYHGLQTRLERGFSDGFLFRVAYTYSKAIDVVNSEVFTTSGGSTRQSQPGNSRADRAVASFDVPHRFVSTFVYTTPQFQRGFVKAIASDWTISGIFRIQSGAVETPYVGGIDVNGDGSGFNDRPALNNPNAPENTVAISGAFFGVPGYYDANFTNTIDPTTTRYIVDPNVTTGLAGRNTLRAPYAKSLDMSFAKGFRVPFAPETHKLEFRLEFFNITNTPTFTWDHLLFTAVAQGPSDGNVLNPFFNQVHLNGSDSRTGRIQVRYSF